ncbi:MAG: ABC transporter permease subunit [Thermoanaerobaculia bacterium]
MSGVVIEETIRRHITNAGYLSYVALLAIVSLGASQFQKPAAAWPSLIALLAMITGSAVIGPEFSSGTLQLILVKPITRATYLLSRVAGVVAVVWAATLVAFFCEAVGRLIRGMLPWRELTSALVNTALDVILIVSLLALLGSITRAYFNVAIYIGTQIGLSVIIGVLSMARRFPEVVKAINVIDRNLFPEAPPSLNRDWMLLVLTNAAVALVLACLAFRRREVPYGAD